MSTYIVDALMIGRMPHSALPIAASSLGNTIYYTVAFCAIRLLTGLDTLVAQAQGREDERETLGQVAQGFYIALAATPIVIGLTLLALHLLPLFGVPSPIAAETAHYLRALVWSTPALLLYWVLRFYLQATGRGVLIMVSLVTAAVLNWLGDWMFIYGRAGFRPMGIAGSGWASVLVRLSMVLVLFPAVLELARIAQRAGGLASVRLDGRKLAAQWKLGWAPSLQNITDLGFSTYMSILCSHLGAVMLAGQQVVLDLDAVVYQVPAGLAYATTTRVGRQAGLGSAVGIKRASRVSLVLCLGFLAVATPLFAGFRHFWASLYTNDLRVVAVAAPVFVICAVLQWGDGITAIIGFSMAGVSDTRTPFLVNTGVYWLIGTPLCWLLGVRLGYGLNGLWIGRAVAAIATALLLAILWWRRVYRGSASRALTSHASPSPSARHA